MKKWLNKILTKRTTMLLVMLLGVLPVVVGQQDKDKRAASQLREQLKNVEQEEKKQLMEQLEDINSLLFNGVIDEEEAKALKLKAAKASAEKIEQRQASLRERIFFLEGVLKEKKRSRDDVEIFLDVDTYSKENEGLWIKSPRKKINTLEANDETNAEESSAPIYKEVKTPTTLDVVFATGLNNTVRDGITWQDIEDERDYQFYSSRFLEFGLALKTPLWNKNGVRLKYGISYQFNELEPSGNRVFSMASGVTRLEEPTRFLGESRFLVHNLVLPIHIEFGPTKLKNVYNRRYYSTSNQFKIGIGGYIGYNLDAEQQNEYPIRIRNRLFTKLEVVDNDDINLHIYGLSGYVGFGAFSLYGKYDLNPIFNTGANDEHFVSVGLRIDL